MPATTPSPDTVSVGDGESPAIRLQGISKRFGFREILRDVSLDVSRGECLAIYGQNGAGKSSLARIISTQWAPSSGSGEILGHKIGPGNREIRSVSGKVADQSFLRSELNLDENLAFFHSIYGVRDTERSEELLARFGLKNRRKDLVSTYSQGMIKRANIIRSLLHDPELWILDEPFSGLDQEGQGLLKECIQDFSRGGRTVVLVTHLRDIGDGLATTSVEIKDGYLVSQGRPGKRERR